jgi:hypothetical protein
MGAVILAPACGLALAALPRGDAFSVPAQAVSRLRVAGPHL